MVIHYLDFVRVAVTPLVNAESSQMDAPVAAQIQVVLNWFEELKQRVPAQ